MLNGFGKPLATVAVEQNNNNNNVKPIPETARQLIWYFTGMNFIFHKIILFCNVHKMYFEH